MADANITRRTALRTLALSMASGAFVAAVVPPIVHAMDMLERNAPPAHLPEDVRTDWANKSPELRDFYIKLYSVSERQRAEFFDYIISRSEAGLI